MTDDDDTMNEKEVKFTKKKERWHQQWEGKVISLAQLVATCWMAWTAAHKRKQTITEIRIVKKSDGENQRTFSVAIADRVV